ncbi:cobalamin biosynthesis protein [Alkalihalophilus marmarensis]|jgi:cobalt-precorrin 5A hydrolase|uniref:Cobalamin biosynthesis protein CbiG n=1 Tax=Alkalihalophilus marmarensis DSM 21297 TaxID=1188261 RepID=U6SNM8_9BACI|nr:cobalamin biosynthesis protein [Alkalihalophilus marmarensis]ERN52977.1 cobalamin biosynthesis protein CbiG [Alkalihalophilus marmarensis DSM 21297]MCM3488973.1 cobalamin biosynthesis protein [Alkalihalophilus marmarensis]
MTLVLEEGKQVELKENGVFAIVAITKHGVNLARGLHSTFQQSDLFYMSKFEKGDEDTRHIQLFEGNVRLLLPSLFQSYKGIIMIVSLGAVVRMIAPILKDKKTDPAVVVIDDKGEHVISVLSGHLGGANELTKEVANILDAKPVITTASDVQKTIAVDLFGSRFGWEWESAKFLTPVSASVVNEEHVAIVQESGEKEWWNYDHPLPDSIKVYASVEEAIEAKPKAALIITHRQLNRNEQLILENGVLYRPKVIVLGIGCNRGTSLAEIENVIEKTLEELRFSIKSVKAICSIDLKKDEEGLIALAQKYNWDFICYSADELNKMSIQDPSDTVYKFTGAYGVSEPAAMLYSGSKDLALVKKKSGNVTISVALIPY